MDAKSRAKFINSVTSGTNISCPKCGTNNQSDSKFCVSCGAEITISKEAQNSTPTFADAKETAVKGAKYVEPNNVFAQGLPSWSIEPPQVMVRRH